MEASIEQDDDKALAASADDDENNTMIDMATLSRIIDSCDPNRSNNDEDFEALSLEELGLFSDESFECHLVCNQKSLMNELTNIVENRIRTDVQVVVQGKIFDCHLSVLQVSTEYFKQFSSTNSIIVNEPELTKEGFEMVYEWIINPRTIIRCDTIIETYLAARFLKIPELLDELWIYFENTDIYYEGTAFKLYLKAIPYSMSTLQSLMLTRVNRFFLTAVTTEEYLKLNIEQVYALFTTCAISVNSEMEVFMSVFHWMMYDWEARKQHTQLLMKTVRFNLMPAWYILSLKTKPLQSQLRELLSDPIMQDTLNKSLSYTVTQHFIHSDSPLQKTLQMQAAQQREWIIDEMAPHHHLFNCPEWQYLDYKNFMGYLGQISAASSIHYLTLKLFEPANFLPCCQAVAKNCKTVLEM